jgi:hypothetical protein
MRPEEVLAANQQLFVIYVVRDVLKDLWPHHEPQMAPRA